MATEKHLSEASHGDPKGAVADSLQPSRNLKGGGGEKQTKPIQSDRTDSEHRLSRTDSESLTGQRDPSQGGGWGERAELSTIVIWPDMARRVSRGL